MFSNAASPGRSAASCPFSIAASRSSKSWGSSAGNPSIATAGTLRAAAGGGVAGGAAALRVAAAGTRPTSTMVASDHDCRCNPRPRRSNRRIVLRRNQSIRGGWRHGADEIRPMGRAFRARQTMRRCVIHRRGAPRYRSPRPCDRRSTDAAPLHERDCATTRGTQRQVRPTESTARRAASGSPPTRGAIAAATIGAILHNRRLVSRARRCRTARYGRQHAFFRPTQLTPPHYCICPRADAAARAPGGHDKCQVYAACLGTGVRDGDVSASRHRR